MFSLIALVLFLSATSLGKVSETLAGEKADTIIYAVGNHTITPDQFRLALCVAATNYNMEKAKEFLVKIYAGRDAEKIKAKIALVTIYGCLHKLPLLSIIPVRIYCFAIYDGDDDY